MPDRTHIREHVIPQASAFVSALVVAFVAQEIGAQEDRASALKDRVMRELPGALARLDTMYSQVRVSGSVTREKRLKEPPKDALAQGDQTGQVATVIPMAGLESATSSKIVLWASHGLRKVHHSVVFDKYYDEQTHSIRDSPETPANPSESVICITSDYSFRLRWEKGVPIVTSFGAASDEGTNATVNYWHNDFLEAPCGIFGGRHMSELMSLPSFSIRKVTATPGPGGEKLLVEFEYAPGDLRDFAIPKRADPVKASRNRQCWIELSPNNDWSVHAYGPGPGPTIGGPARRRLDVVYGQPRNGIAIPQRIIVSEPVARRTQTFECGSVDFAPLPASEFTLGFYGLPELSASPRSARWSRAGVAAFVVALAALSASIALKYYGNARKKA
jgi:hypothetical protein